MLVAAGISTEARTAPPSAIKDHCGNASWMRSGRRAKVATRVVALSVARWVDHFFHHFTFTDWTVTGGSRLSDSTARFSFVGGLVIIGVGVDIGLLLLGLGRLGCTGNLLGLLRRLGDDRGRAGHFCSFCFSSSLSISSAKRGASMYTALEYASDCWAIISKRC